MRGLAPPSSSSATSFSYSSSRSRRLELELLLDVADLGADVLLELREVLVPALVVDPRDQVGGEVDDLLEALRRDVEQVAEAARDALEVPDVRDGRGELDVAHALAAHLRARDLDAAALTDDALEADALVLAAVALPVLRGTEDLLAEQAVLLGLERAVVDRLGLLDLAVRPLRIWSAVARAMESCAESFTSSTGLMCLLFLLFVCLRRRRRRRCGRASRRAVPRAGARPLRRCPARAGRGRCRATRSCGRRPRRARGSRPPRPPRS